MKKHNITISQYQDLFTDEFNGLYSKMIHRLSVIYNTDPIEYEELRGSDIVKEYDKIRWVDEPINSLDSVDVLNVEGVELKLIDFKTLTFGQFIDLEHYINAGHIENIQKIISVLYLKYEKKPFENPIYEDYSKVNIDERSNYFLTSVNINEIMGTVNKYLKFRSSIFDSYSFFEDGLDDINPEDLNEEELKIYNEEIAKMNKSKKTMWEDILAIVSNEDLTKFETILNTNVFLVFNRLSKIISDNRNAAKSVNNTQTKT